jgi:hypothetical protein
MMWMAIVNKGRDAICGACGHSFVYHGRSLGDGSTYYTSINCPACGKRRAGVLNAQPSKDRFSGVCPEPIGNCGGFKQHHRFTWGKRRSRSHEDIMVICDRIRDMLSTGIVVRESTIEAEFPHYRWKGSFLKAMRMVAKQKRHNTELILVKGEFVIKCVTKKYPKVEI